MGASGRIQLQLLVFGQAVTWFGLGISLYFQWENQVTLKELQWLGEVRVRAKTGAAPGGRDLPSS